MAENEVIKVLTKRASQRNFSDKEITDDVLDRILEAARHSASGGNLQPFSIIKIRDKKTLKRMVELGTQDLIKKAPVNLIFCIDWNRLKRWAELERAPFTAHKSFMHFWIGFIDTVIAAQNVSVAADSMGLGSVYIGTVFTDLAMLKELKPLLGLPDGVVPVVLVTMGYPEKRSGPATKLPLDILVHDEKYRDIPDEELLAAFNEKYASRKFPLAKDDKRLESICGVCESVGGKKFADDVRSDILRKGEISFSQFIFGLHYTADFMQAHNPEFVKVLEEFGLDIIKQH